MSLQLPTLACVTVTPADSDTPFTVQARLHPLPDSPHADQTAADLLHSRLTQAITAWMRFSAEGRSYVVENNFQLGLPELATLLEPAGLLAYPLLTIYLTDYGVTSVEVIQHSAGAGSWPQTDALFDYVTIQPGAKFLELPKKCYYFFGGAMPDRTKPGEPPVFFAVSPSGVNSLPYVYDNEPVAREMFSLAQHHSHLYYLLTHDMRIARLLSRSHEAEFAGVLCQPWQPLSTAVIERLLASILQLREQKSDGDAG